MYPSTVYRVVAKALIVDPQGRVLLVKENQDSWSLPGGGVEHGETPQECLIREIKEEIGVGAVTIGGIMHSTTVYLDKSDIWMTWVVYSAAIDDDNFTLGDGVTDAQYVDVTIFESSEDIFERLVFEAMREVNKVQGIES